ncbi:MAG: IclR family transcriptional regulator [Alicyclobacillaceae bacterium]|nr:IclR family transcriptional regulator [Alicyclobacillaceae bacterium]
MLTSVRNACLVLKSFRLTSPELGITEIAKLTQLPKSTVYKLVATLCAEGFLEKNPVTGRYRPAVQLFEMSQMVLHRIQLTEEALPFMRALAQQSGETVLLSLYENGEVIWILKIEGTYALKVYSEVGRRNPVYAAASGKAMMAFMEQEELERLFSLPWRPLTPKTNVDKAAIRKELEDIRRVGYATQFEEIDEGIASIAAPIFDHLGRPVAAVVVAGAVTRLKGETLKTLGTLVKKTASEISRHLGYSSTKPEFTQRAKA